MMDTFKLSIPIILGQIGSVLMGLTDTIMLGQVGKAEVAASGVANQVYFLFTVIGMGTMAAMAPLVASSKSAKNKNECGELLRTGIELSFLLSVGLCIILFLVGENFQIFNQPAHITAMVKEYLRVLTVSTIPLMLFLAVKQFSDGLSLTKPAMLITLAMVILNAGFNWVFIYGNFTFPMMGIKGAAVATLLSRILMALTLVIYVFRHKAYETFMPPLISTFNTWPVIVKILRIGLPGGMQLFFEVGAFAGAAVFVGWLGTSHLAAHQIVLGLAALSYMMSAGLSVAGSVRVAGAFGRNNKREIFKTATSALVAVAGLMMTTCLIFIIFNEELVRMFIQDETVVFLGSSILLIAGFFQLSDGLQVVALGILRGIEDVNIPTWITLLAYWGIALPIGYTLSFLLEMGIIGIWYGLLIGLTVSALLLTGRFYYLLKKGRAKSYQAATLVVEK